MRRMGEEDMDECGGVRAAGAVILVLVCEHWVWVWVWVCVLVRWDRERQELAVF